MTIINISCFILQNFTTRQASDPFLHQRPNQDTSASTNIKSCHKYNINTWQKQKQTNGS